MTSVPAPRTRRDLCPGVLRPWPADDGLLVRVRLVGGHLTGSQLGALLEIAARFGDGRVHLTSRANLQLRALGTDRVPEGAIAALEDCGLLPSRTHELVRNILMSPQSGFAGGRADLRGVARELDGRLLADPALGELPGRFLFVLDDGRGDLVERRCDLGVVALDRTHAQLRIGDTWGEVILIDHAAARLAELARDFLTVRGAGPSAAWHVRELGTPLAAARSGAVGVPRATAPLAYGPVPGGVHHAVPDGVLASGLGRTLDGPALVVTPWRGIFVPDPGSSND